VDVTWRLAYNLKTTARGRRDSPAGNLCLAWVLETIYLWRGYSLAKQVTQGNDARKG